MDGVVVHPRIGISRSIAYLSDAYFDAIEHIVATAARLGMKIVLYDEAMDPSGTAHGEVGNTKKLKSPDANSGESGCVHPDFYFLHFIFDALFDGTLRDFEGL